MRSLASFMLVALLGLLLAPGTAFAQTGTIVGTVIDTDVDEPLPGATVLLPDLDRGVTTDAQGNFSFTNVPAGEHLLRVTFVGYQRHEQTVNLEEGGEVDLEIMLSPDVVGLDQLVVTGYGVQRKREVTGSISQLQARDIETQPVLTADQALQGRTSGVRVTATSGEPGGGLEVNVRGTGSITAGSQPLYVVDGIPITSDRDIAGQASNNPLSSLRASDIESIEVLKDAAAASIYGAQAANGVVLITTRRGVAGSTQITAEMRMGQVDATTTFDMVNTDEWVELQQEAWGNYVAREGLTLSQDVHLSTYDEGVWYFRQAFLTAEQRDMLEAGQSLPTYDWQDEAMQIGAIREFGVRARGGTENTQFFISGAYDFNEGQYIRSDFERYALRTNLDHQATERLSFEANINLNTQTQQGSIRDGNFINGVLFGAPLVAPNIPIYNEDGDFNWDEWYFGNPIGAVSIEDRYLTTNRAQANVAGTFEFMDNLFWRTNGGVDYALYRETNYRPPEGYYEDSDSGVEIAREVLNYSINSTLNYTPDIGQNHNLTGLVGGEYRREYRESIGTYGRGFPSPLFRTVSTAAEIYDGFGWRNEYRIGGVFSRLQYNLNETYFATASLRYDGSSRFGADRRWGAFWSTSFGWDVANEGFMQNVDWLSQLRPRISYGTTGNSDIGNYAARGLYETSGPYAGEADLRPDQLANPQLTWEQARTLNLGVDIELLGGRVFSSVEAFRTTNESLLLDRELPIDSGFGEITENVGKVRNEGIEIDLSTINVDRGDFRWSTDFNITFQRNEVLELVGDQEQFGSGTGSGFNPGTILVGEPIHIYYMPRYAGVNPADGRPMWYDSEGNITYTPDTVADAEVVGSPYSDYYGGFNNQFSYRGLTLDVFFQYDFGADTFKQQQTYFYETPQWYGGMTRNMLDRWQEPGDITEVPRMYAPGAEPGTDEGRRISSRHVEDRSYIRLKDVRLSYRLPQSWTDAIDLRGVTVYVQGFNLMTWTGYDGMDPEIYRSAAGYYPQPRKILGGLTVDF